ncbi:MAG TPA: hypothetical protein VFG73_11840 [Rhodanobacteraceae bacterium]|nr:hypothetical protein [Rhodanobacteraceae bacterium]
MGNPSVAAARARLSAAAPFVVVAALAMFAGGLVAAAIAHAPGQRLVWMVAYLVLVVGMAQAALGAGQAWLAAAAPSPRLVTAQCAVFNAGNLGVIAGTLLSLLPLVAVGSALFAIGLGLFLVGLRGSRRGWPLLVCRLVVAISCAGAVVGLALSIVRIAG